MGENILFLRMICIRVSECTTFLMSRKAGRDDLVPGIAAFWKKYEKKMYDIKGVQHENESLWNRSTKKTKKHTLVGTWYYRD